MVSVLLAAGAASSASNDTLMIISNYLPLISDRPIKEMVLYYYWIHIYIKLINDSLHAQAYRRRRHFLTFLAGSQLLSKFSAVAATAPTISYIAPVRVCLAEQVFGIREMQLEIIKFI